MAPLFPYVFSTVQPCQPSSCSALLVAGVRSGARQARVYRGPMQSPATLRLDNRLKC